MQRAGSIRASAALAAYAEPLLDGRRVIVFGDATSAFAAQLLERGARLVHVYDPDPGRVAVAVAGNLSQNVSIGPLSEAGIAVREGAFDVGIVEDLTAAGPVSSVLKRLRRALSQRAVALIAASNPEVRRHLVSGPPTLEAGLDYYQLYDAVAGEFAHVRMLGQTPFVGFAVVDFAATEVPEPSFDSAFVPGGAEEPEWFVALASSFPIRLDEFQVIQIPLAATELATPDAEDSRELARAREAETRARQRMAELEAELAELRARGRVVPAPTGDSSLVAELRRQVADRDRWMAELEARAAVADARADEVQAELEEERERAAREPVKAPAPDLEPMLLALRSERDRMAIQLEEQARRIAELTAPPETSPAGELAEMEELLQQRGAEIRRLEQDLRESDRVGKELLDELDRLAELNAQREAELQVALWTRQAETGNATAGSDSEASRLSRAEAQIERQATLLEQLRRPQV